MGQRMQDSTRIQRQAQIEEAAYRVLEEKGFAGATMLAIAREAKASHETLYGWYGDKTGLFRALVARNARHVGETLEAGMAAHAPPIEVLAQIGPPLIALLSDPRAVALNRAAAADPGGALAQAILQAGRDSIGPLIVRLLIAAREAGVLGFDDPQEALQLYLDLLIGDLQHRRVIGLVPPPDQNARAARAARAMDRLMLLLAPDAPPRPG